MNITETVKNIIADISGIKLDDINENNSLVNDLDFDSLDVVDLIIQLEEKFKIEINDKEAEVFTVRDLIHIIEDKFSESLND